MIELKKKYMEIKDEILHVANEILEGSHYILGKRVSDLEAYVKSYHGVNEAIGVASGIDALHLSLKSLGMGPGDEVITSTFAFFATVESILNTGAKSVFEDIDSETYNIDPSLVEKKIKKHTKAIMPVHIFGHPADMEEIMNIGGGSGLKVVGDCAQAFGASWHGRKTGSFCCICKGLLNFWVMAKEVFLCGAGFKRSTVAADVS